MCRVGKNARIQALLCRVGQGLQLPLVIPYVWLHILDTSECVELFYNLYNV
jgi:hypothetical protein